MAMFRYTGFDGAGANVSGEIDAVDLDEARAALLRQGLMIASIKEIQLNGHVFGVGQGRVTLSDIEFLTSELSVLLDAGLKIDRGIDLLKSSSKKPQLAVMLDKIGRALRSGQQLSQALQAFPEVFDPLYINLVSIGEATGKLPDVFRELSKDLSFRRDLQQKVSQALTYPAVILVVCLVSIGFIFNYVVPNMKSLFAGQQDLPVYTALLLSLSDWLAAYQWWLAGAVTATFATLWSLRKQPAMIAFAQKLQLSLPVLSSATVLVERIRFNSGLSMMLAAGVALDRALELSCGNIRHPAIRQEIMIALGKVKRGEQLSQVLRQTRLFPQFLLSLLKVGEESGQLARIFAEIAQRSQREFSSWVTRVTALLEPLLIIVMGGIVGGVVVVMMMSITSVTDVSF